MLGDGNGEGIDFHLGGVNEDADGSGGQTLNCANGQVVTVAEFIDLSIECFAGSVAESNRASAGSQMGVGDDNNIVAVFDKHAAAVEVLAVGTVDTDFDDRVFIVSVNFGGELIHIGGFIHAKRCRLQHRYLMSTCSVITHSAIVRPAEAAVIGVITKYPDLAATDFQVKSAVDIVVVAGLGFSFQSFDFG
ncbi:MAG: hypothetical protein B7W97_00930, partial [Mycobacterium sp. 20-66-4]